MRDAGSVAGSTARGNVRMKNLKVVVIGVGSASFGRGILADLLASPELREFDLEIHLVDIAEEALRRMTRFAHRLKEHFASPASIHATTDRREALPHADYVIAAVARDRWLMWEKDFYIPLTFGFRHVYGENGGPGAAFHTLRSLHLMIPICRDMEELCPDALLLNFTNPESRVCLAVRRLTRIRAVGLCHGPVSTRRAVARILGRPESEVDVRIGGINHFHWVLGVKDPEGRDLLPELHRRLDQSDCGLDPFTYSLYRLYGALPFPSPSHTAEYVPFAYQATGTFLHQWGVGRIVLSPETTVDDRVFAMDGRPATPSYQLLAAERARRIEAVAGGQAPLTEEMTATTDEVAVPIIAGIELDQRRREISANVPNTGGLVSNLPEEAIVEVPIEVDGSGVRGIEVGPLPVAVAALCQRQVAIQELLVQAYAERSRKLLLQALTLEPVVDDLKKAEEMIDVMLRAQKGYLPELR